MVNLFGCIYEGGRPEGAPKLRRKTEDAVKVVYGPVLMSHQDNSEPPPHDPAYLPHMYSPHDITTLFPIATAPDEIDGSDHIENENDWRLREPEHTVEGIKAKRR